LSRFCALFRREKHTLENEVDSEWLRLEGTHARVDAEQVRNKAFCVRLDGDVPVGFLGIGSDTSFAIRPGSGSDASIGCTSTAVDCEHEHREFLFMHRACQSVNLWRATTSCRILGNWGGYITPTDREKDRRRRSAETS
ncbi:hypothetical protein, partial [Burkholderia multivorans]|uniref:hypothetical protein n=1 Tax=Burkholderia multivorans TaxID=87883 RepID=UPI0021BECC41